MNFKKALPILLVLPLVAGCNKSSNKKSSDAVTSNPTSETTSSSQPVGQSSVDEVYLDEEAITAHPGEQVQLHAHISGSGDYNPILYYSENSSKADVTSSGKVLLESDIEVGSVVTVTVASVQDPSKSDSCTITIVASMTPAQYKAKADAFVENVQTNHNYTMSMVSYAEDDPEDILYMDIINIDDKAFYFAQEGALNEGYIYQKDQGYISFEQIPGGSVIPDYFISTNPSAQISKLVPVSLEYVLEATYTQDSEDPSKFNITDQTAKAILLNLTGFLTITMVIEPEKVVLSVDETNDSSFLLSADFQIAHDEQFFDAHATFEVHDLGTSANAGVSAYIANPTKTWTAPTQYSAESLNLFEKYFNEYVPPFLTHASYGFDMYEGDETDQYNGMHFFITDLNCGDLSSSYGLALEGEGFELQDGSYHKVVEHEETSSQDHYYITLTYTSPSHQEAGQLQPTGYFNPRGIFQVEFYYNQTSDVNSVSRMNEYIVKNDLRRYVPLYPESGTSTSISNFRDRTVAMNQLYGDGDDYVFYTSNDFIRIQYANGNDAKADAQAYITALKARGFTDESRMDGVVILSNPNSRNMSPAKVYITDPDYISATTTLVYLMYNIYQYDTLPVDPEGEITRVLRSISASGMNRNFNVGDPFTFDGVLTATYSNNEQANVTPTSVTSPDMSTSGQKEIVVTYRENGVTRTYSYTITVVAVGQHVISYKFYAYGDTSAEIPAANLTSSTLPTSAAHNDPFHIEIVANEGYTYSGFYFNDELITDYDFYDQFESYNFDESVLNLTMPDCDVEFWFFFEVNETPVEKHAVSFDSVEHVVFTPSSPADFSQVSVGSPVQFDLEVDSAYELVSVSTNDAGTDVSWVGGTTYSFTMPSKDVQVTAVVQEKQVASTHSVTINPCSNATVTFSTVHMPTVDTNAVSEGEQIYVRVVPDDGYEIVSVSTSPYTIVHNLMPGSPIYSFLMPDEDTVVNVVVQSTGGEEEVSIEYGVNYCYNKPMSNPAYYNEYRFNFTDESHGTYVRVRNNAEGFQTVGTISFTYTINANGEITFTLVSGDKTNFEDGYRLFDSSTPGYQNTYGQLNDDGTITVSLCDEVYNNPTILTPYTFTKAS